MTQEHPAHLVPLKDAVASLRVTHRDRIHAVARWSLAQGRPVPMEHIALIIAGRLQVADEADLDRWTSADVSLHLITGMPTWCNLHRAVMPETITESFRTYLDFLSDQGLLAAGSAPLAHLLEPLQARPARRPSRARRPAPA